MINILRPFAALVTALSRDKFFIATIKLTFFYVLSTAVILFVSSAAILTLFAPPEMELPFRPEIESSDSEVEHGEWSSYELREHLASVVALVDIVILVIVSAFSYHFARRTLQPIKNMHEAQKKFMGDVAHELRTPLSVMKAGAETVLKKQRSISEYELFISDVQEEVVRLTRLSNQLLQLLRTETVGQGEITEVKISKIVETEWRRFTSYAQEHRVTISGNVSPGITIRTEEDSLIEILQNILKNAIDYNHSGGKVTISLLETETDVVLEISDTGVGISTEGQARVFDRFVKGDSTRTSNSESGVGLGLSIVKGLVQKLSGQLSLKSELGIGTTVTISLPRSSS